MHKYFEFIKKLSSVNLSDEEKHIVDTILTYADDTDTRTLDCLKRIDWDIQKLNQLDTEKYFLNRLQEKNPGLFQKTIFEYFGEAKEEPETWVFQLECIVGDAEESQDGDHALYEQITAPAGASTDVIIKQFTKIYAGVYGYMYVRDAYLLRKQKTKTYSYLGYILKRVEEVE